ncbi:MAG: phosphatase PAP2 family protein [Bacteroidales bacterium]|jgi:membrane-associated phospholipid phosphatase|nr:phosphatase PAP2 family protein [Bacteroidales bacterium]
MKNILLPLILVIFCSSIYAQDIVDYGRDTSSCSYKFRSSGLILPLALVGAGSASFYIKGVRHVNREFQRFINAGDHKTSLLAGAAEFSPVVFLIATDIYNGVSRYGLMRRGAVLAVSAATTYSISAMLKYSVKERRPDRSSFHSFPSGHAAMAFMGAESFRISYGREYPLIATAVYGVAVSTGFIRMYANKHYLTDVLAGAGIGILGARVGYWMAPSTDALLFKIFGHDRRRHIFASAVPSFSGEAFGVSAVIAF